MASHSGRKFIDFVTSHLDRFYLHCDFSLYAWDHIFTHRKRLQTFSWITLSGLLQLLSGTFLIVTGIVILLYGADAIELPVDLHYALTFALIAGLFLHFLVPKNR